MKVLKNCMELFYIGKYEALGMYYFIQVKIRPNSRRHKLSSTLDGLSNHIHFKPCPISGRRLALNSLSPDTSLLCPSKVAETITAAIISSRCNLKILPTYSSLSRNHLSSPPPESPAATTVLYPSPPAQPSPTLRRKAKAARLLAMKNKQKPQEVPRRVFPLCWLLFFPHSICGLF